MREGSKVVCVDDSFETGIINLYKMLPIKDKTYTVRGMSVGVSTTSEAGEIAVYLVGLENPCSNVPPFPERGFRIERFREIEEPVEEAVEYAEEMSK
jgi:hypothetical protein